MNESAPAGASESTGPRADRRNIALFDLDGTLTDPAEGIVGSLRHAMTAIGLDPEDYLPLEQFIGPPLQETFAAMGLDPGGVSAAISAFRERFALAGIFENRVYDGMTDVLVALLDNGWQLAVATSKPEPFAERILAHFDLREHFSVVAGATMDGGRRHKRDVVIHALDQLGVDPTASEIDTAVMIGDRRMDIDAGHSLNLMTIGVVWGYGRTEELIEAKPSALAATPADLLSILSVARPQ